MIVVLTDENFEKEISETEKPVLVDFWMENCFPCTLFESIFKKLSREKEFEEKIVFARVNFNLSPLTIQKYGLRAAPTIIFFKKGKPLSGFVGLKSEIEIREWLNNLLKNDDDR